MSFVDVENNLFEVYTLGRIMGKSIAITKLSISPHRKTLVAILSGHQKKHPSSIFFSNSISKTMNE